MTADLDVLIAGAGPTGTALAIDLRRRGHTVRIIDQSPSEFDGSRAKGVQPRSLEVLEDLGALDEVLGGGSTYPKMGIHLGPVTIPWTMIKTQEPRPGVPYASTWLTPQFRVNAALHTRLRALGLEPETSTELVSLTQDPDGVTATVTHADGSREDVTARYLFGADGGSSTVRKSVGIPFEGTTDEADRMIIFDAVTEGLPRNRWHVWPGLGKTFVTACPLPHSHSFQWMIRINPDEAPDLSDQALAARVSERIGAGKVRLGPFSWKSVFRPNVRLAAAYRAGRVFLGGDAAHVHTPAGAQGLNTGLQDAYNLGWKLSQVLHGAPAALLDSYETERRPIAAAVLGLSTKKYEGLGTLDLSSIKRGDVEQQLGIHYPGGPLAPHDAPATATLHVGDRAPDARLRDGNRQRRLFELLDGPHFTLLATGPAARKELAEVAWPNDGATLVRVAIDIRQQGQTSLAGADPAHDLPDKELVDRDGEFSKLYGTTTDTLILIRPDGYIAAITTQDRPRTIATAALALIPVRAAASSG